MLKGQSINHTPKIQPCHTPNDMTDQCSLDNNILIITLIKIVPCMLVTQQTGQNNTGTVNNDSKKRSRDERPW